MTGFPYWANAELLLMDANGATRGSGHEFRCPNRRGPRPDLPMDTGNHTLPDGRVLVTCHRCGATANFPAERWAELRGTP